MNGTEKFVYTNTFDADAELIKMLELKLEKGRFYSDSLSSDLNKVIVNEAFLRDNKITDPIGATFSMRKGEQFEIIGVIKDFHYRPVTLPVAPLAIKNRPYASYCLLQLQNEDFNSLRNTLSNLKNIFRNLSPDFPVEISFLDAAVEHMYRNEIQFRKAFFLFAGCAIVISCLGIFALSLFVCQNRTKEIGIRKVNGASASHIFRLLNRDFLKWVLVAFVISCPISYHVMKMWLEKFAYKTQITWWIFAMAGIITVIIALVTISWQSLQAATENPVKALRYE
jgi:putative ABC transport system permease protein